MMNSNYAPEIASAHKFLIDHNYDGDLRHFIAQMQANSDLYSHKGMNSKYADVINLKYYVSNPE